MLVTAAPNIWYFKDTNGDGRTDERKVLFTGFGEGNQQLRVNGLTYGLDNWIYGANGRSDGEIRRPDDPASKTISIRRRDFRFKPATGEFEAIAGFSQFGLPRDDWGNRFPSWNTIPIRHVVIEDNVLSRNPWTSRNRRHCRDDPSTHQTGGRIYSISPTQQRFNRRVGGLLQRELRAARSFGAMLCPEGLRRKRLRLRATGRIWSTVASSGAGWPDVYSVPNAWNKGSEFLASTGLRSAP